MAEKRDSRCDHCGGYEGETVTDMCPKCGPHKLLSDRGLDTILSKLEEKYNHQVSKLLGNRHVVSESLHRARTEACIAKRDLVHDLRKAIMARYEQPKETEPAADAADRTARGECPECGASLRLYLDAREAALRARIAELEEDIADRKDRALEREEYR